MPTAVVTGSASGIGAATRQRLETDGWSVIGVDLEGQEVSADLSTPEGRSAMVTDVTERADGSLDGVVACAGVGSHLPSPLIAKVNYFGAVATLDGLFPLLKEGDNTAAVALSSNSVGMMGPEDDVLVAFADGDEERAVGLVEEIEGPIVYANSKRGLTRWVRTNVTEWGDAGVRINAIAPGNTETPMLDETRDHEVYGAFADAIPIPVGHTGNPEDIAALIAFLLSKEARFISGSMIFIDGGTDATMRPDAI